MSTLKLCLNFKSTCIYINENCVLVTNFKTWGFLEHFQMESGSANIFRLSFTTEKSTFQTNKYFVNKTPAKSEITYRRDHACIFRAYFVKSYRFYFTKHNFLRRCCGEINNKLDMTLNGDVSALTVKIDVKMAL